MKAWERAQQMWRAERWGEPRTGDQWRLWTLFFTNQEPEEEAKPSEWTRPPEWVEHLIRR